MEYLVELSEMEVLFEFEPSPSGRGGYLVKVWARLPIETQGNVLLFKSSPFRPGAMRRNIKDWCEDVTGFMAFALQEKEDSVEDVKLLKSIIEELEGAFYPEEEEEE